MRADGDLAVAGRDVLVQRPEDGVVLEQVGHRLDVAEIVGGDDLEVAAPLQVRAEEVPPDPPEPVDPNANSHACLPVEFASSLSGTPAIPRYIAANRHGKTVAQSTGPATKLAGRRGSSEDDLPLRIVALRTLATDGV